MGCKVEDFPDLTFFGVELDVVSVASKTVFFKHPAHRSRVLGKRPTTPTQMRLVPTIPHEFQAARGRRWAHRHSRGLFHTRDFIVHLQDLFQLWHFGMIPHVGHAMTPYWLSIFKHELASNLRHGSSKQYVPRPSLGHLYDTVEKDLSDALAIREIRTFAKLDRPTHAKCLVEPAGGFCVNAEGAGGGSRVCWNLIGSTATDDCDGRGNREGEVGGWRDIRS